MYKNKESCNSNATKEYKCNLWPTEKHNFYIMTIVALLKLLMKAWCLIEEKSSAKSGALHSEANVYLSAAL